MGWGAQIVTQKYHFDGILFALSFNSACDVNGSVTLSIEGNAPRCMFVFSIGTLALTLRGMTNSDEKNNTQ